MPAKGKKREKKGKYRQEENGRAVKDREELLREKKRER